MTLNGKAHLIEIANTTKQCSVVGVFFLFYVEWTNRNSNIDSLSLLYSWLSLRLDAHYPIPCLQPTWPVNTDVILNTRHPVFMGHVGAVPAGILRIANNYDIFINNGPSHGLEHGSVYRAPVSMGHVGKKHCCEMLFANTACGQGCSVYIVHRLCSRILAPVNTDREHRCPKLHPCCTPIFTSREHG